MSEIAPIPLEPLPDEPSIGTVISQLVAENKLRQSDADHVKKLSEGSNEPIDQILAKLGLITEIELGAKYANLVGVRFDPDIKKLDLEKKYPDLNVEFCQARRILPISSHAHHIEVAVVDPFDEDALSGLSFALGAPLQITVTTSSCMDQLNAKFSLTKNQITSDDPLDIDISADADRLKDMASEEPIVRLVGRVMTMAAQAKASDIHIEPGLRDAIIKFRVDGILREEERLPRTQALAVVSRIKILSQLDIAERRRPQDGRFTFPLAGQPIDVRVSTIPTEYGESIVIRIFDQSSVNLELASLGFSEEAQTTLHRLASKPNGILLVTGPTGSGKTTTLYTILERLADGKRKILTIEDPIEKRIDKVSQSQANPVIGFTFAEALRSFLRHDPDVIMVGEIRDLETAKMSVQAALTGHMVLSTLHTNDAVSTITRLIDMGIEDYLIASTLNGVIAQRLVRRVCDKCQGKSAPEKDPCEQCNGVGFHGRVVISEILEINDQMRSCIRNGWLPQKIKRVLEDQKFISMRIDGQRKIRSGLISQQETMMVVGGFDD